MPDPSYLSALFNDPAAAGVPPSQSDLMRAAVARFAQQSRDTPFSPTTAALDVAPFAAGPMARMLMAAPRAALSGAAGATGAAVLGTPSDTGEAAPRLTREQLQRLEEMRQRSVIEAEARARGAQAGVDADRQRAQDALAAQSAQREAETRFQRENEEAARVREAQAAHDQAYAPFQQRYPALAEALPAMGAAAAFAIPYLGRAGNVVAQRMASRPWMQAVERGEAAKVLPSTIENVGERAASRGELEALMARTGRAKDAPLRTPPPQVEPMSPWLSRAGMAAGVEGALVQPEFNAAMLPSDSPDKYPSPQELMVRMLMAGAAGTGPALIGSHLPVPIPPATVPMGRIEGLTKALAPPATAAKRRPAARVRAAE